MPTKRTASGFLALAVLFNLACAKKQVIPVNPAFPGDCNLILGEHTYEVSGRRYVNPDFEKYFTDCGCPELARKQKNLERAESWTLFALVVGASVFVEQLILIRPPGTLGENRCCHQDGYNDVALGTGFSLALLAWSWDFFYLHPKKEKILGEFKDCSRGY